MIRVLVPSIHQDGLYCSIFKEEKQELLRKYLFLLVEVRASRKSQNSSKELKGGKKENCWGLKGHVYSFLLVEEKQRG